ncbi:hypothetical protein HJC23_012619 [Cyclotella cryptica]|uniref:SGNH hydrolase-type esterase domain-containing protein n=1 Tax=Cyclotella cryptica TaxID=29204 RepID=A0ABD3QLC5_9STRA|eukprot:CCRYP_004157-RA/>CCRYP_004157-RA protein AED:0.00 eAED:0.00 QI:200/-1/1/1/-1/1/1/538/579
MNKNILLLALTCFFAGMATEFVFGTFSRLSTFDSQSSLSNKVNINMKPHSSVATCDCDSRVISPSLNTSLVEELIPEKLRSVYAPENLQFNVTRSMIRQSRPIIGNTERLHAYIQKLRDERCTSVLFLGGSVTSGHNAKGPKNAFPRHFIDWLNYRYPCRQKDGTAGMHEMKRTHAQNSQTHFIHWSMVSEIDRIDLVFIEFNVNDHFLSDIPHALEDKGPIIQNSEYIDMWYSEIIIRRLLLLRKPDPLAIVTFNADYVGRSWATFPPYYTPEKARKSTLFRSSEEPVKLWMSSLYEIPVFSASIWMLPLASKLGMEMQFPKYFGSTNPYSTQDWHADVCCHPHPEGHKLLSLVLAYCIVEEEKELIRFQAIPNSDKASIEQDFTMKGLLRDPVYLSPAEEEMYVQMESKTVIDIDFTDPDGENRWDKNILSMNEWKFYADNADNDKFGLISSENEGGPHVSISVEGGKLGLIEISFVMSYENFGLALAWLDDESTNTKQSLCKTVVNKEGADAKNRGNKPERLIAYWDEDASVPTVQLLKKRLSEGERKILHICLTPRNDYTKGDQNKFKLLGIRVY